MAISKKQTKVTTVKVQRGESRLTRAWRAIPIVGRPRKPKKAPRPAGEMTFFEHLGELRNRLVWSALAVIIGSIVGYIYRNDLLDLFTHLAEPHKLISTKLLDQFGVYMNLSIYVGLMLASPVIVYNILAFLAPALEPESDPGTAEYQQELKVLKSVKRSLWFFIPFVVISFAAGVVFAYYIIIPQAVHVLLDFSEGRIEALPNAKDFIGDLTKILFATGVIFELPIFMFLLTKIKIVTVKRLVGWWKWALVLSLVAAAFITPSPEPVSQALIAVPVFGLYWLGILLARFA